jgi:hypothetical protein
MHFAHTHMAHTHTHAHTYTLKKWANLQGYWYMLEKPARIGGLTWFLQSGIEGYHYVHRKEQQ